MYTNRPARGSTVVSSPIAQCVLLSAWGLGIVWATPAVSQSKPDWGADVQQTRPGTIRTSPPWGATGTPLPQQPRQTGQVATKAEPVPAPLARILERPDSDVIALSNGQSTTVKEIRAQTNTRRPIVDALHTGNVPAGSKRVRLAVSRSKLHDELLNASKVMRDTARREAGFTTTGSDITSAGHDVKQEAHTEQQHSVTAWSTPGAASDTSSAPRAGGAATTAAAWTTSGATSQMHPGRQQAAMGVAPIANTQIHSGIGNVSMPQSGSAFLRNAKPASAEVSEQPAQSFVGQNRPAGIAIINGHSKGVQLTPGGLYNIIGSGFGGTLGAVDLVGPHLPGGKLTLPVTQWSDQQLQAQLPEPVTGVTDQPVTLRVTTRAGTLFTKDVQFYATRQPITLSGTELDLRQAFELSLANPNDWSDTQATNGTVTRTKSGNNIDCPSIGKDSLRTKLPPEWALVEVAISSWLPTQGTPNKDLFGQGGDTVVSGSYGITQIPAGITNQTFDVNWGVLRSHTTNGVIQSLSTQFGGNDFGWSGNDGCVSSYEIEMTVVGPAGLRPF